MPVLDSGAERLSPELPRRFLVGCFLIPAMLALASNDLGVSITPGVVVLDDHAFQFGGREDVAIYDGSTLADLSEVYADVVAYWNETTATGQVIAVDGTAALTSAGAEPPTDAEIEAAMPDPDFAWVRLGRVKFTRSGSTITMAEIDHGVRPLEITTDRKAAGLASSSHENAPIASPQLYRYLGDLSFDVDAADLANGDVITNYPLPLIHGKIGRFRAVVTKAITTGAKAATLNLEIGTTNLTGGTIALAGAYALGAVVASAAITGGDTFKPGDTLSVEASAVTAFIEGRVKIVVELYELVTAPA